MPRYVLAIEPKGEFLSEVRQKKGFVKSRVGDQIYLSHPPHMTFYLGDFPGTMFDEEMGNFLSKTDPVDVQIEGWHVFHNDVRTGGNTICYKVKNVEQLQDFQLATVEVISKYRSGLIDWVRNSTFMPEMQECVIRYGYPYVGKLWIPHFAVSSIEKKSFQEVWGELKQENPMFSFLCDELTLFELIGEEHLPIRKYKLKSG